MGDGQAHISSTTAHCSEQPTSAASFTNSCGAKLEQHASDAPIACTSNVSLTLIYISIRRLLKLDMLPKASGNMEAVRKSLTAGLFFNAAQLTEALDVNLVNPNDHGAAVYKLVRSTCTHEY